MRCSSERVCVRQFVCVLIIRAYVFLCFTFSAHFLIHINTACCMNANSRITVCICFFFNITIWKCKELESWNTIYCPNATNLDLDHLLNFYTKIEDLYQILEHNNLKTTTRKRNELQSLNLACVYSTKILDLDQRLDPVRQPKVYLCVLFHSGKTGKIGFRHCVVGYSDFKLEKTGSTEKR